MSHITDVNITCDAALDQDINQEIGFLGEGIPNDEYMMEIYGICPVCRGSGEIIDPDGPGMESCYNPNCFNGNLKQEDTLMATVGKELMFGAIGGMSNITKCMEEVPCDNCNGTGRIKGQDDGS